MKIQNFSTPTTSLSTQSTPATKPKTNYDSGDTAKLSGKVTYRGAPIRPAGYFLELKNPIKIQYKEYNGSKKTLSTDLVHLPNYVQNANDKKNKNATFEGTINIVGVHLVPTLQGY